MCLLTTSTLADLKTVFLDTPRLLEDVYDSNADGLGVMYPSSDGLIVTKVLPKSLYEVQQFFDSLPSDDRQVACHWRMRTHGDVDMDNCHPYQVSEGIYLAHNGVLHTGNDADRSKSDTWHFIRDYLAHMTPDMLHDAKFGEILGGFIGSNRFAIMSADGRLSVVNKGQGVEAKGVWFSNTYAWTPSMLIPSYKSRSTVYYPSMASAAGGTVPGGWPVSRGWQWADEVDDVPGEEHADQAALDEMIWECVSEHDVDGLAELLEEYPEQVLGSILNDYNIKLYRPTSEEPKLSTKDAMYTNLLIKNEEDKLLGLMDYTPVRNWARQVAECLTYYCVMEHTLWDPMNEADRAADSFQEPADKYQGLYAG